MVAMRQTQIFAGSSHPELVDDICQRLGQSPAKAELGKFSNGETKVQLNTSTRGQDVFIVQTGTDKINDTVMELLIMIDACKGGSASSITAVLPYFPYSRQSKKKSHRGSITARMIANLLHEAGVNHVITIDLHASQMQGFFHCPVDNLVAEPMFVHWIKMNVPEWSKAVVVSKNPGGTKRVTSLADALKLDFGIIMTDRKRPGSAPNSLNNSMNASAIFDMNDINGVNDLDVEEDAANMDVARFGKDGASDQPNGFHNKTPESQHRRRQHRNPAPSNSQGQENSPQLSPIEEGITRIQTAPHAVYNSDDSSPEELYQQRARGVIHGRLVQGHIVEDVFEGPNTQNSTPLNGHTNLRTRTSSDADEDSIPDTMAASMMSVASSRRHAAENALGGSADAAQSSDEEEEHLKNPELESTVTLVGDVKDRTVFLLDDMIDKSASWIAAAETVRKRGGATKVYCMATHGILGGDCLAEMEECDCIDAIVITNALPVPPHKLAMTTKLKMLDVSTLLAESIRRNHHGESMSKLFTNYNS